MSDTRPSQPGHPSQELKPVARVQIVAMGVSTGGPGALAAVIPRLPGDLRVPVTIVQHMPAAFVGGLAESLDDRSAVRVLVGQDGMPLEPGHVYIAPGDWHMKVAARDGSRQLALTDEPPVNHCKPAADCLFGSVAREYGPAALGVVMTGMGADGREGLRAMKARGATVLAQDQASCVVFGMPMEAIRAGLVDHVVALDQMAAWIVRMVAAG